MVVEVDRSNPKVYRSPGGHEVTVYEDGYTEFSDVLSDEDKELIYEVGQIAFNMLPLGSHPREVFSQMGWKEIEG